jgi:hypothetical protein
LTTLDIGLTAAFFLLMALYAGVGALQFLLATNLVAYFLYPRIVWGEVGAEGAFNGISTTNPAILAWHFAIALTAIYWVVYGKGGLLFRDIWPVIPLVLFASTFFAIGWTQSRPLAAGFLHLLVLAASWAVGLILYRTVHSVTAGEKIFSKWVAGIALFVSGVCVLQALGVDVNKNSERALRSAAGARDTIAGQRFVSVFGEPTAAGKFLFLLAVIGVVWLFGRDPQKKKQSVILYAAILVVAILTQTRTNFAAAGMLFLFYAFVANKRNRLSRIFIGSAAGALSLYAAGPLLVGRSAEDQAIRWHTIDVAIEFITQNSTVLWAGIGPNRYYEVLAPIDAWVALNYPVHNYFIYLVVELGVLGTLLYLLPSIVLTTRSIKAIRADSDHSQLAKAWLCCLPGLLLITMLGWGMLSIVAPALFLVMGYVNSSLTQDKRGADRGPSVRGDFRGRRQDQARGTRS